MRTVNIQLNQGQNQDPSLIYTLNIQQLKDKSALGVSKVFSLGFEYLLAGVAQEYCNYQNKAGKPYYQNLKEFNKKNRLTPSSVVAYPFFISLANGHSKSLYSLFGDFYTFSIGPASLGIYNMIHDSTPRLTYFKVNFESNPLGIEILHPERYSSFNDIQEAIEGEKIDFEHKTGVEFRNIYIAKDRFSIDIKAPFENTSTLYQAVKNAIEIITVQSNGTFFSADRESIVKQARYFSAFRKAYDENVSSFIDFSQLESPGRRPFYQEMEFAT
jgi:hypothetical protein